MRPHRQIQRRRSSANNVIPIERARYQRRRAKRRKAGMSRSFVKLLAAVFFATFSAVYAWNGPPQAAAVPQGLMASAPSDTEGAWFTRCVGPIRYSCVIDGDTIWYEGTKIRLADINAPELSDPECAYEARLATRATDRLTALLNAGNFSLVNADRAHDKYGRELKVIRRNGRSIGGQLVSEGLAESWKGYRRGWC